MRRHLTLAALISAPLCAAFLTYAAPAVAQSAPATATATATAAAAADYTVFIDPPTNFVFVKLPQGWKFAGKAEGVLPAQLPANVVTRLLPAERALEQVARAE
jgi:hypothetical protein